MNADEDVRKMLEKVQQDGTLSLNYFACPGAGDSRILRPTPIDYAYTLGYRDENGRLSGAVRGEDDLLPIFLADAGRQGILRFRSITAKAERSLLGGPRASFCPDPDIPVNGALDVL